MSGSIPKSLANCIQLAEFNIGKSIFQFKISPLQCDLLEWHCFSKSQWHTLQKGSSWVGKVNKINLIHRTLGIFTKDMRNL